MADNTPKPERNKALRRIRNKPSENHVLKWKKSIFTKLFGCFILYAVIMVITFLLCLLAELLIMTKGNPESVFPDNIFDENGEVASLETIQSVGGWVEELDDEYHTIRIYGEKKTHTNNYSAEELLDLTSLLGEQAYIGFLVTPENTARKFLCIYDKNMIDVHVTFLLNPEGGIGTLSIFPIFFPISILEIVLISLYLKKKIKNPLDEIVSGMENLKTALISADQGNIPGQGNPKADGSVRISIKTEAEFEKIVETFNLMAKRLEEEKAEREFMTQKKNQMLLELSHDIRTPVATIKSYVNALEENLVPEEKKMGVYHIIDGKTDRVQKLSDDMFTMLKMDNPEYMPHWENTDMCEFLRQLCAGCHEEITEAGFDFVIDIPENPIPAQIDPGLFSRAVENLLTNAVRYNRTGKNIAVSLCSKAQRVILSVSDDGAEIDEDLASKMFLAFSRGDASRQTSGGTGLGLAISRIIAEKHGGNIRYCRKDGENVFVVELPGQPA